MGIILSNRLRAMQEAAANFGDSIQGIRESQRLAARQANQDKMAGESHALAMRQGNTAAGLGDLQFKQAQDQQAAGVEAQGFADQLQGFGQDVPEQAIGLPGMQPMQSPRPAMDPTADNLKDRLRASMENATAKANGKVSALTAADIRAQRTEAAAKKERDAQEFTLGIDKTKAEIAGKGMEAKKTAMEIKKMDAELANLTKGGMDPEKAAAVEGTLRSQFIGLTKPFQEVRDSFNRLQNIKDSPAGDVGLIFAFMKINDPGASVQEGDKANVSNTAGVPERIRTMYNNALTGASLDPKVRADLRAQARSMFSSQKSIYDSTKSAFENLAIQYGVDEKRATVDLSGGVSDKSGSGGAPSFKSAREAMAAGLPAGTRVMINGEEAEM